MNLNSSLLFPLNWTDNDFKGVEILRINCEFFYGAKPSFEAIDKTLWRALL